MSAAVVAADREGFTGTGFADFVGLSGEPVEWSFDVASAGARQLELRYANGDVNGRTLELTVNGTAMRVTFPPTGAWTSWANVYAAHVHAGLERLHRLSSTGASGPNVGYLNVR